MKPSTPGSLRSAILVFVAGAAASAASILIILISRGAELPGALDAIARNLDQYIYVFLAAGVTWVVLGYLLTRFEPPERLSGWAVRIVVAAIAIGPISLLILVCLRSAFDKTHPPAMFPSGWEGWFGYLATTPFNVLALIKGAILVAITNWLRGAGMPLGIGPRNRSWIPGPASGSGPGQVTRLLCGNAFLAGDRFRETVLGFYKDKWTAVAPEFGLDVRLLANACARARAHDKAYRLPLAGVAIVGLIIAQAEASLGVAVFVLGASMIWLLKKRRERALAELFRRDRFNPDTAAERLAGHLDPEVEAALPQQGQELIVYRGFSPFVGAGIDLGGWSFATFVDKPKIEGRPGSIRAFTIGDLYADLDAAVGSLHIPELMTKDYYFVCGTDVRDDHEILIDLADRPRQSLWRDSSVRCSSGAHGSRVRRYKCIQVTDWGGELVVSHFLRCALHGESLFVEMKRFLLPPLLNDHRRVDALPRDGIATRVSMVLEALFVGPVAAAFAPFALFAALQEHIGEAFKSDERLRRRRRRAIENDPAHDYGASTSLRTLFAQDAFMHFFQKSDADFWSKVVERKILDEIVRFLDAHGIDTKDIRDRQTTILNSGILVQGGDVKAESLAVGKGAQATKVETRETAPIGTGERA